MSWGIAEQIGWGNLERSRLATLTDFNEIFNMSVGIFMGLLLGQIKSVFLQTEEEEFVEYLKDIVPELLHEGRKEKI